MIRRALHERASHKTVTPVPSAVRCHGDGFARKRDSNKQTKTNHPKGMARIETEDRIKLLNWPVPAANREHL